ncbi:MAG: iron-containing alcohol dehydrogenase [Halanaerobiales bacterium]
MKINDNIFTYEMPTRIVYGIGSVKSTGDEVNKLGAGKVLVITDKGVFEAGILDPVFKSLSAAGVEYVVYDEVRADSGVDIVEEATELAKKKECGLIMGIGGGSSMDTAKAVAAMVTNPGDVLDYAGLEKIENKPLPIIAIPTTAGTGSEVTVWAVISDKENHIKTGIGSVSMMPDVAICDPELSRSLPAHITAATGMDALTHAVESYVNTATQPISEAMAEKSIKLIADNLRLAVANGDNMEARDGMLMGSLIAALAFNETRLGIAHAWSSPLGAYYPIPHGIANAILLPNVMEFNLIANPEKFAKVAELMGEKTEGLTLMEAARKSVDAVRNLMQDIDIPLHFKEIVDIDEDMIPVIAEDAIKSGNNLVNPHRPDIDDLIKICRNSL